MPSAARNRRRTAAIAEICAGGAVWHEPDRINRGRNVLAEVQAGTSGWVFERSAPHPSWTTSATSASGTAPPGSRPS